MSPSKFDLSSANGQTKTMWKAQCPHCLRLLVTILPHKLHDENFKYFEHFDIMYVCRFKLYRNYIILCFFSFSLFIRLTFAPVLNPILLHFCYRVAPKLSSAVVTMAQSVCIGLSGRSGSAFPWISILSCVSYKNNCTIIPRLPCQ